MISWYTSQSAERPLEVEHICNNRVFLRRNITTEQHEEQTMFVYEEALLTEQEYLEYLNAKATSKIDYVAMMTDVDLPVEVQQ